jgi:putative polyhydroxyalkanoate system protein
MSDIRIRRAHNLPPERARALAEAVAQRLRDEFDLEFRWRGSALAFSRDGVQGTLTVSAAEIRIQARLGLLLSFLKPHIEQEIEAHLDRLFAETAKRQKRRRT